MTLNTVLIDSPQQAAQLLLGGGLVAFPTETVFGLGVDARCDAAVEKLFAAKGRPSSNPLIVHIADATRWSDAAAAITPSAQALFDAFAPGPLTVVLPRRAEISPLVTAGLETVGVRVPDHPVAAEILRLAERPIAAPSANRSGRPSGTRWQSVLQDLDGRIDAVFRQDGPSLGGRVDGGRLHGPSGSSASSRCGNTRANSQCAARRRRGYCRNAATRPRRACDRPAHCIPIISRGRGCSSSIRRPRSMRPAESVLPTVA